MNKDLQSLMGERLIQATNLAQMAPEYLHKWKATITPSGRVIPTIRASGRRISDSGFTGWPTPDTLNSASKAAGWQTPAATEARLGYQDRSTGKKGAQESLTTQAINCLAGSGLILPGTNASTGKLDASLALNEAFSLWLMGYPLTWLWAGLRAHLKLSRQASQSRRNTKAGA